MRFEGEDSPERRYWNIRMTVHLRSLRFNVFFLVFYMSCVFCSIRFSGTIVGVEDFSPQWTDSRWRSLRVLLCSAVLVYKK